MTRTRIATNRRSIFVERAMVTWQAFKLIDDTYPPVKFSQENAHWTHNVHQILNHEQMSGEEKIDALLTLIGRIKAKTS